MNSPTASLMYLLLILLPACADFTPPTLTPTRTLSGPTLAPSSDNRLQPPTEGLPPDVSSGQNDPTAAALPSGGDLPPLAVETAIPGNPRQLVEITMADQTFLTGDLYALGIDRVPGILVLAADRSAWAGFAAQVQAAGFTVLVIGLRDPTNQADFHATLQAFTEVGTVDPARIGVVGAAETADLALIGCASDLLCDTVVLLSPLQQTPLLNAMSTYNPRPLLVAASQSDADSYTVMQALQPAATGEILLQPFDDAGRGTEILRSRPDVIDLIITWFTRQLVEG